MQIKIVSVGSPEMKQGPKAKYSVFELEYAADGQLRKRKIMSFAKEVYGVLKASQPGEFYDVEVKKNGEYWDWVSAVKASGTDSGASGGAATPAAGGGGGWSRETSEERAQRQVMIVRQSSLGHAVNALGTGKTIEEYINTAKDFEAYVLDFSIEPTDTEVE